MHLSLEQYFVAATCDSPSYYVQLNSMQLRKALTTKTLPIVFSFSVLQICVS